MSRKGIDPASIGIKEGDFFEWSWGYDQTNADFYQVVGMTKACVKLRKVATRVHETAHGVVPIKDRFVSEKVMLKRVGQSTWRNEPEPFVTMASYGWCSKWDGKPAFDTTRLGYAGH